MDINKIKCVPQFAALSNGSTCDAKVNRIKDKEVGFLTPIGNYSNIPELVKQEDFKRIRM